MTGTALDHVLAFLIPFFLRGAAGDQALGRQAAVRLLESHGAVTDWDVLLAAEIIAFSFTILDNLGKSMADPDMPISTCLRLRSNANALSRRAERTRQSMQHGQQETHQSARSTAPRPTPPPMLPPPPTPPLSPPPTSTPPTSMLPATSMQKVRDAIIEAAPSLAETLTTVGQTMSRQQRRYLMRKTEQARAAQERDARKTARLSTRTARDLPPAGAGGVENNQTPGTMPPATA
jgi:hypothetical protein